MAGGLLGQGSLTTYNPTFRERATDLLRGLLFSDDREGQRKAERLSSVLETITPYGVATGVDDMREAVGQGDYATAGVMGAMAMVPGYHGSPMKGLKRLERRNKYDPAFLAVDDGTQRPAQYAQGYTKKFSDADEGQLYKAQFDDAGVLDARTPEGRAALVAALDAEYPLGGEAFLAEKKVAEGQLPGWGDDLIYRALERAGYKGAYIKERPDVVSAAIFDPSIVSDLQPYSPKIRAYHGSPHSFDRFDMSKGRTAKHIYTTPIEADAKHYGPNTYEVEIGGRVGDFRPDGRGPEEIKALQTAFDEQGLSDYFDSFDDFLEAFDTGDLYQRFASQRPQNYTMNGLAEQGYDAAHIPDAGFGGKMSESVVVLNPEVINIVRKYGIAGASAMLGYNVLNMVDPAQARQMQAIDAQRPQTARSGW